MLPRIQARMVLMIDLCVVGAARRVSSDRMRDLANWLMGASHGA